MCGDVSFSFVWMHAETPSSYMCLTCDDLFVIVDVFGYV